MGDLLLINVGFALAYFIRYQWQWLRSITFFEPYTDYLVQQAVLTLLLMFTYSQMGVWQRRRGEFWLDEAARVMYATAAGIGLMVALTFFVQPTPFSRLLFFWGVCGDCGANQFGAVATAAAAFAVLPSWQAG
ncbi:MAG: hypothetical protein HC804_05010 [Anaerolineae bacterium]|nr:hypothetical protein [Anaerolineae bacterium]